MIKWFKIAIKIRQCKTAWRKLGLQLTKDSLTISRISIHFIDKDKSRNAVFSQQLPKRSGIAFNAIGC